MSFVSIIKTLLDAARILAFILLLIYLPALIVIALAVVFTSSGPPLVRRVYKRSNGQMVDLWEFRTECWRQWEPTPVGRHLRRMNMHRLPSLINVLRGEIHAGERVRSAADFQI